MGTDHLEKIPSDEAEARFKIRKHASVLKKALPKAELMKQRLQKKGKIVPEIKR